MKQTSSRRSILSLVGTGLLVSFAGCSDSVLESARITVANADTREHRVGVWVVAGGKLAVAESVTVSSGGEAELAEQLGAPLREKRYRITAQLDPPAKMQLGQMNPAYATSFTFDEGFDRLQIVVDEDESITARPIDYV